MNFVCLGGNRDLNPSSHSADIHATGMQILQIASLETVLEPYLLMTLGTFVNINSFATAKGGKNLEGMVEVCCLLDKVEGENEVALALSPGH